MTSSPSLTLYVEELWDSPFVFTAFVALKEKELPFETRVLRLAAKEQKLPAYTEKFPMGRVPGLEHGDFCLNESVAIVEYLDDVFPDRPVLPRDARDRARARMVLMWLRTDLQKLRDERPTTTIFFEPVTTPLTPAGLAATDRLLEIAARLLPEGRDHLFGDFSIADADLALMIQRLVASGDAVPERLASYAKRVWQRPSIQAFARMPRPKEH
jgi:glutathione S-transferase